MSHLLMSEGTQIKAELFYNGLAAMLTHLTAGLTSGHMTTLHFVPEVGRQA